MGLTTVTFFTHHGMFFAPLGTRTRKCLSLKYTEALPTVVVPSLALTVAVSPPTVTANILLALRPSWHNELTIVLHLQLTSLFS